jgi:hypothetical protein
MSHTISDIETAAILDQVKVMMLRRGLDRKQLAGLCGVSHRTLENWFTGHLVAKRARTLIEAALDFPFFTSVAEWRSIQAIRKAIGTDPRLLGVPALLCIARARGIPGRAARNRAALLALLADHFQKNRHQIHHYGTKKTKRTEG